MKFKELSSKTVAELQKELVALREQVNGMMVKNRLSQMKTTHHLRHSRRDIARILTALKLKI